MSKYTVDVKLWLNVEMEAEDDSAFQAAMQAIADLIDVPDAARVGLNSALYEAKVQSITLAAEDWSSDLSNYEIEGAE